jgi:hypothetical protein
MRDIMVYDEAHYFGDATGENINLGGVITSLNESTNPIESEKHYIHQKSATVNVTGYSNEFPIDMDWVKGDAVFDDFYEIYYKRKTGSDIKRDHYIVNLWEPITGSENTYKARKINQSVEITEANGDPGSQKTMTGSLKGGDFVYGTFNTSTKVFTETA